MGYVDWRRPMCGAATIATGLDRLRLVISYMCPGADVSWLLPIAKRLAAQAAPRPARLHLVTSDQLYALGMELMDGAKQLDPVHKGGAFQYRDGLIIALLALVPLRRRTSAAHLRGIRVSGQLAPLPPRRRDFLVHQRSKERARSKGSSRPFVLWNNGKALRHGAVPSRGSGPRSSHWEYSEITFVAAKMVYTLEELAQFCRLSAAGRLLRNRCEKPAWQSVKIKSAVTRKPRPRFPNGPFDPDGLCHPRRTRLSALRPIRWPAVVPPRQVEQAGRSYARASATSLR